MKGILAERAQLPLKERLGKERFIVDQYMKRNSFDQKLDRIKSILEKVKRLTYKVITENAEKEARGHIQKGQIKDRGLLDILRVQIDSVELFRAYHKDPKYLFVAGMWGADIFEGISKIKVGGRLLNHVEDEEFWIYYLAHELSHKIENVFEAFLPNLKNSLDALAGASQFFS